MVDLDFQSDDTLLLVIDVQERFAGAIPTIAEDQPVGSALCKLITGCRLLEVPVLFSEQVPDKLGPTLGFLRDAAPEASVHAKSAFSCGDDRQLRAALAAADRPHLLVAGIESHVCVLSTVDDLLRRGYRVTVVTDAIASRDGDHVAHAVATLRQLGALCLPLESVLLRLQRDAADGCFREISKLIR